MYQAQVMTIQCYIHATTEFHIRRYSWTEEQYSAQMGREAASWRQGMHRNYPGKDGVGRVEKCKSKPGIVDRTSKGPFQSLSQCIPGITTNLEVRNGNQREEAGEVNRQDSVDIFYVMIKSLNFFIYCRQWEALSYRMRFVFQQGSLVAVGGVEG